MRVIRVIMYESDDQAKLDRQLSRSLQDGWYDLATRITVGTVSPTTSVSAIFDDRADDLICLESTLLHFLKPFKELKQSLSGPPVGDPSIFDNTEAQDLLRLSFVLIETCRQNLGLAGLIDAAKGTGMSYLGYMAYLGDMKALLGSATVVDGTLVEESADA